MYTKEWKDYFYQVYFNHINPFENNVLYVNLLPVTYEPFNLYRKASIIIE